MQGASHDLGCTGRAFIDQDHDGGAVEPITRARIIALGFTRIAGPCRNDFTAIHEHIGHANGLVEQTARIVTHIDDQARQRRTILVFKFGDALLHHFRGAFVEAGDAHIGHAVVDAGRNRAQRNGVTHQRHVERVVVAAGDRDGHRLAHRAAHQLDGVIDGNADNALAVDGDDLVIGPQARPLGRRV